MPYIASRRLNVGDEVFEAGEVLPEGEAESWPNLRAYLDHGWLRWAEAVVTKSVQAEDETDEGADDETDEDDPSAPIIEAKGQPPVARSGAQGRVGARQR